MRFPTPKTFESRFSSRSDSSEIHTEWMFEFQRILFEKAAYDRAPGADLVVTSACGRVGREHTASDGAGWSGEPAAAVFTVKTVTAWPHWSLLWARLKRGSLSHRDPRGTFVGSTPCLPSHLVTASHSCVLQVTSQGQRQRQKLLSFSLVVIGKILVWFPPTLLCPLYLGTLGFLEAQELWPDIAGLFLSVFLASTHSRSAVAHMPLWPLQKTGRYWWGKSVHLCVCPEAPATCGFGTSPNHTSGGGLFGEIPLRTWPLPLEVLWALGFLELVIPLLSSSLSFFPGSMWFIFVPKPAVFNLKEVGSAFTRGQYPSFLFTQL